MPDGQPKPQPVAPKMPRGLPPAAQKFWKVHATKLEALGLLTEVDGPAFAMLATHWAIASEAAKQIKSLTDVDENGATRKHPLLQVLRDNSAAFRQYAAEFGLTPSARERLSIPEPNTTGDDFFRY